MIKLRITRMNRKNYLSIKEQKDGTIGIGTI